MQIKTGFGTTRQLSYWPFINTELGDYCELYKYKHVNQWTQSDETRFIESMLLSIPMPCLYLESYYHQDKGNYTYTIMDGNNRINTIKHLYDKENPLVLKGWEYCKELENKTYYDLLPVHRNKIDEYVFTIYSISDTTKLDIKYDLFKRWNNIK